MQKCIQFLIFTVFAGLLSGCNQESSVREAVKSHEAEIITVNYPLFYFVEQLAGDLATVTLPIPSNVDPAQWQPKLDDIIKLQSADLVVLNGAGYSNWLNKVTLQQSKLVDSSAAAKAQFIELTKQATHSHGPAGEHSHEGYAFTTWMDLDIAKQQASTIAKALIKRWPAQQDAIQLQETTLLSALTLLDEQYQTQAQKLAGKQVFYSHPVYQYFERRYQLAGHSFHWEPEEMPSDEEWGTLERLATDRSNALFIWEDQPSDEIAKRMTAMGLAFVVIRPAANRSENDWLIEQQLNLQRLEACCQ
jgi:zinc transport system substrate-binding protein